MRGMVCFANRPARPAEPGDTISLRGLCPLKLPFDMVVFILAKTAGKPVFLYAGKGLVIYWTIINCMWRAYGAD